MGRRTRKTAPLGITLDAGAPQTIHWQIREQIRRAILERRLALGALLPSSRLLAAELGCSRGTVLTAIEQLIAEGYLVSRTASGVSVAPDLPDEMLISPPSLGPPPNPATGPAILPDRTIAMLARVTDIGAPEPNEPPIAFPIGQPDRQAFPFRFGRGSSNKTGESPLGRLLARRIRSAISACGKP